MKRLACVALAAVSLVAAPPNPVAWKLTDVPAKPVKAGARFTVNPGGLAYLLHEAD
jgi:hypothetical protein